MANSLQTDEVVCESGVSGTTEGGCNHKRQAGEVPYSHAAHQRPVQPWDKGQTLAADVRTGEAGTCIFDLKFYIFFFFPLRPLS